MSVETQKLPMRPTTAAEFSLVEMKMADENVKRWMGSCHRVVWPLTPPEIAPRPSSKLVKVALEWCFLDYALFRLLSRLPCPLRLGFPLSVSPFSCFSLLFQLSFGSGVWEQIEVDKQKSRQSYRQSTYENNNTKLWTKVVLEIFDGESAGFRMCGKTILNALGWYTTFFRFSKNLGFNGF